jgi:hypothetical protein
MGEGILKNPRHYLLKVEKRPYEGQVEAITLQRTTTA